MPKRKASKRKASIQEGGGASSSAVPRDEHTEFQRLCSIFSDAAAQLGLSGTLGFKQDFKEFVSAAAACKAAHDLHDHVHQKRQLLTKPMDQLLFRFMKLNPGLSLETDVVLKRSFLTHCMLTFELDSLAQQSLLSDPQLSANDVAVRLTLLAYICEFPREMQLEAQKLLPPGRVIPKACLLEPSQSEARRASTMWDPVLLTIWFKSMSASSESSEWDELWTFYLFGKLQESISEWSSDHPDRRKIDEVLKDTGFMQSLWAALSSTKRFVLESAIAFLHLCIEAAPESSRLAASTGKPPANSMQSLLQMGALDALTAALKHLHHLVLEEPQDAGISVNKSVLRMDAFYLTRVLLESIKTANMLDYQAAAAQDNSACDGPSSDLAQGLDILPVEEDPGFAPWPKNFVEAHMKLTLMMMETYDMTRIPMDCIMDCASPQGLVYYPHASWVTATLLFVEDRNAMTTLLEYLEETMQNEDLAVRYSQTGFACLFLRQMLKAEFGHPSVESLAAGYRLFSALPMDSLVGLIVRALEAALADSALHTNTSSLSNAPTAAGASQGSDAKRSWALHATYALQLLHDQMIFPDALEAFQAHAARHAVVLRACDLVTFEGKDALVQASEGQQLPFPCTPELQFLATLLTADLNDADAAASN